LSCCRDKDCRDGGCRVRGRTLRTLSFVNSGEVASGEICFWWPCFWWRVFRSSSSDPFLQTHFFRRILSDSLSFKYNSFALELVQSESLWIVLLIMDPVHLNKLFSKSNWWFLIPCYYQNSIGDIVKHPLFQHVTLPFNLHGWWLSPFTMLDIG